MVKSFGWCNMKKGGVDNKNIHTAVFSASIFAIIFILSDIIKEELKFTDIEFLKQYMHTISLELEDDDPFSDQFADNAKEMGIIASYFGWDMPHKMERVRQVQLRMVIMDKTKCPITWKNFQEAAYDQNSRLPMLEKRPDQHGLDGTLHMLHPEAGDVSYKRRPKRVPAGVFTGEGWNRY